MAVSTFPRCLVLVLCVSVTMATPVTTGSSSSTPTIPPPITVTATTPGDDSVTATTTKPVDVKAEAMEMVRDIRQFANEAKDGMAVSVISQKAQDLEESAAELLQQLPKGADGCETNLVIKMAAAGTGSHEVLTLLQAEDEMEVLNGRLSLSLAFLENVAQQIEDELALSTDIGGHLAAIVFGADMTDSIAQISDEVFQALTSNDTSSSVARREWKFSGTASRKGVSGTARWTSKNGRYSVSLTPSLSFKGGLGVKGSGTWRSKSGRTSVTVSPSWSTKSGFGVGGTLNWKSRSGKTSFSASPSFSQRGGFRFSGRGRVGRVGFKW